MKESNTTPQNQNKTQVNIPFESPLERWKLNNCYKCKEWKQGCNDYSENGIDRMFLCMTSAHIETVGAVSTDPAEIMQDAAQAISDLLGIEGEEAKADE